MYHLFKNFSKMVSQPKELPFRIILEGKIIPWGEYNSNGVNSNAFNRYRQQLRQSDTLCIQLKCRHLSFKMASLIVHVTTHFDKQFYLLNSTHISIFIVSILTVHLMKDMITYCRQLIKFLNHKYPSVNDQKVNFLIPIMSKTEFFSVKW